MGNTSVTRAQPMPPTRTEAEQLSRLISCEAREIVNTIDSDDKGYFTFADLWFACMQLGMEELPEMSTEDVDIEINDAPWINPNERALSLNLDEFIAALGAEYVDHHDSALGNYLEKIKETITPEQKSWVCAQKDKIREIEGNPGRIDFIDALKMSCTPAGFTMSAVLTWMVNHTDEGTIINNNITTREKLTSAVTVDSLSNVLMYLDSQASCIVNLQHDLQRISFSKALESASAQVHLIQVQLRLEDGVHTAMLPRKAAVHASVHAALGLNQAAEVVKVTFGDEHVEGEESFDDVGAEDGCQMGVTILKYGFLIDFLPK